MIAIHSKVLYSYRTFENKISFKTQREISVMRKIDLKYILGLGGVTVALAAFYVFGGVGALANILNLNGAQAQTGGGLNPAPQAISCPANLTTAAPSGSTNVTTTDFGANQTLNAGNYFSTAPLTIAGTLTVNGKVAIYAPAINVTGSIVGAGTGNTGGAGAGLNQATHAGTGPGAGGGGNAANPDGAGGAGHGGNGGGANTSNGGGAGGPAYGSPADYGINQGSGGGGSNCGTGTCDGGNGGGAIALFAQNLTIPGSIRMNAADGDSVTFAPNTAAAGGGSGGGILLSGWKVNVTGILRVQGGNGGNSTASPADPTNDDAAGGGAGGRIKIFAYSNTSSVISPSTVDVRGGAAGTQDAANTPEPGELGTYAAGTCGAPAFTVTKTVDKPSLFPGELYSYTVTIHNTTDGTLTNVVATDDYDQSKILISSPGDFSANDGDKLTSTPFTLAPDATKVLQFAAQVKLPYPAATTDQDKQIGNFVSVSADNYPTQTAQVTVNVNLVSVTKSLDAVNAVTTGVQTPGSTFPMYLNVQNDGLNDLTGMTASDDLSAEFAAGRITSVSNISDGGTFDAATKKISWSGISAARGGASTRKQLSFSVHAANVFTQANNVITNKFTLTGSNLNVYDSNTVTVNIPAAPNIIAVKQAFVNNVASTGTAEPGDKLGFNIQFVNVGSLAAHNFVVSDDFLNSTVNEVLNGGGTSQKIAKDLIDLNTVQVANSGTKQTTNTITWNIGTLNPVAGPCSINGSTIQCTSGVPQNVGFSLNLKSSMPEAATYTFTNVATYTSTEVSGTTNQNQIQVAALPILSLAKCIQPGCVLGNTSTPGAQFTYTLKATNNGTAPATNVIVRDPFDGLNENYLSFISSDVNPASTNPPTWNFATLNPGQTQTINLVVKVASNFPETENQIQNSGQITSTQTAVARSNTVITTIGTAPAMVITKAVDKNIAKPGDTITYTLHVANVGTATAPSVVVKDPLTGNNRDYLTLVSTNPQASNPDPKALTWNLGSMAPGAAKDITIVAKIASVMPQGQTTIIDTGVITSQTPNVESNPVQTVVNSTPQLTIVKSVDKSTAKVGDTITYTLTYKNNGSSDASSVTISDPFTNQNQKYLSLTSSTPILTSKSNNSVVLPVLQAGKSGTVKLVASVGQTPCTPPSTITSVLDKAKISATGVTGIDSNQVTTSVTATCQKATTGGGAPVPTTGMGSTLAILGAASAGFGAAVYYFIRRRMHMHHTGKPTPAA